MKRNTKRENKATINVVVDNTAVTLARTVMNNSYSICNKKIASVPVSLLCIDKHYQRPTSSEHVDELVNDWDDTRCDFLMVSFRDERFYIIDGQHRYKAANYKGVKELPCIIFTGLTMEEEALLFGKQNDNVKKLTIYDEFNANIVSKNTSVEKVRIDMEIDKICKQYNIKVLHVGGLNKNVKALRSLYTARTIIKRNGLDCFKWIMDTIHKTNWDSCFTATTSDIMCMLRNFYTSNKDNISQYQKAIENVMNSYTPEQIIGCARSDYANYSVMAALNICFKELINGKKIIKVGVEE